MSDENEKKNPKSNRGFVLSTAALAAAFAGDASAAQSAIKAPTVTPATKTVSATSTVTSTTPAVTRAPLSTVKSTKSLKAFSVIQLTSPLTKQVVTYQDLITKKDIVMADIETLTEHIVENIEAGNYGIDTVAQGMDYLNIDVFAAMTEAGGGESYGPNTGGTGGLCSGTEGDGLNCGGNCTGSAGRNGSACGSGCDGSAGNGCGTNCNNTGSNCAPKFTDNLASNAFLVNFNEEMHGYDSYMLELVDCYKATILQKVMSQIYE